MNIYLATLGCRLNEAELQTWSRGFVDAGHHLVSAPDRAHVLVMNSCAVTTEAARKSRQLVRRIHRLNPSARIVVTGCYASLEPERVAQLAGVDLVVPNTQKDQLVDLVETRLDTSTMPPIAADPDDEHLFASGRTRAFIKVQDGCRNKCAFCIVTVARGEERSRTPEDIIGEIHNLHGAGIQEIVLAGVHLGGYGSDLQLDLRTLVQRILDETSIPRLRIGSLEPWDLPEGFFELWSNPRLCPHLHLPLQSGCDATLRRMARRCFTDEFSALAQTAREAIPGLTLTTDLIVGFPGEDEQEWSQTLSYIEALRFAHMHIFTYSVREGTRAAKLPGRIPGDVQRERSRAAHAIAARSKAEHLARFVGHTRPVLWETRELLDNGALWTGYTDNYLRTELHTPADLDLENRITPTRLAGVSNGERLQAGVAAGGRQSQ